MYAKLEVHHDGERFADIVKKFLPNDLHRLTWDEETEVVSKVVDYHVEQKVSGITLCDSCHEDNHQELN
jgi:hypothetical protein